MKNYDYEPVVSLLPRPRGAQVLGHRLPGLRLPGAGDLPDQGWVNRHACRISRRIVAAIR